MIDGAKLAFLESVLGVGGAAALSKAVSKAPSIENILLPRTIISWLTVAGQIQYNGSIPGINDSRMSLTKTDFGWNGSIEVSGVEYQLDSADLCKVGAHIAVAIGADEGIDPSVKTVDIAKLGKTIDLLIKARVVNSLAKGWPKDEKENQENLEAHAVFQDMAEEKGKPVEVPQDLEYDWTKDLSTGNTGWVMRNDGDDSVFLKKVVTERPGSPEKTSSAWIKATAPGRINNDGVPVVTGKWLVLHGGVEENGRSYHLAYAPLAVDTHHHVRAIGDALEQHYLSGGRAQDFRPGEALERHFLGVPAQAEPSWYRVQDAKKPSATATTYEAKFGTKKAEASGRGAHERAGTPETLKPDGPIPQAGPTKQQGIPKQNMPRPTGHNPSGPTAKSERSAKISKAQSQRKCHICGHTHFSDGHFTGCKCLTDLAKNISSVSDNKGGFVVTMQSLSLEDIVFVLDTLRGE